jgi:hypothetical protein
MKNTLATLATVTALSLGSTGCSTLQDNTRNQIEWLNWQTMDQNNITVGPTPWNRTVRWLNWLNIQKEIVVPADMDELDRRILGK